MLDELRVVRLSTEITDAIIVARNVLVDHVVPRERVVGVTDGTSANVSVLVVVVVIPSIPIARSRIHISAKRVT